MNQSILSRRIGLLALCAGALLAAMSAQGQTIYRTVGPDGKVSFSDKPPTNPASSSATDLPSSVGGNGNATLPYVLRQAVGKYPVTLYSGDQCTPCEAGRALLKGRGVPFTERTVKTQDDAQALQRISGDASLPLLTVGSQQIKGFSDSEWSQFLTAAGYPKASALPGNYRQPAATPLVQVQAAAPAAPAAAAEANQRPSTVVIPQRESSSNPAGIRF